MPNWCCQNVAVSGDRKELQDFADLINSMPTKEDFHPNGFGKFWLGNLVHALGGDWEKVPCRGTTDPSGDCVACLNGPDQSDRKAAIDGDGFLRISITTAWDVCPDLYAFLRSKYPSFAFGYSATDEFGNFHVREEPDPAMRVRKYEFDGETYTPDGRDDFLGAVEKRLGITLTKDASDKDVIRIVDNWREKQEDEEDRYLECLVYEDVNYLS